MVQEDGTPFWAHLTATAVHDVDGVGAGRGPDQPGAADRRMHTRPVMRLVLSDITARKQAEGEKEALEAQNRQLHKSESLGRMAGAVAHHFNNQLHVVTGRLEMALGDLPDGGDVRQNLTEALRATHRASAVSGQMLTYLGQAIGTRDLLDLSEVCRPAVPLLQAALPPHVRLDVDLPSPGPSVRANANQLQQVLTNLVTNAWEACGSRPGTIHVTVTTVARADDIPTAHRVPLDWPAPDEACACLAVADTGGGMAGTELDDLFDPFFSTKFTGRGMGLPVVLGIVRAHRGAITVESAPGRGSIFRVYLPLTAGDIAHLPVAPAPAPAVPQHGTVLLVDDEEMVRQVTATTLTRLGFTVLVATDGVEALEVFRQHAGEIRCVVCDLTMPRMNGWETLTALRHLAPGLPVILASGYGEAQVLEGAPPERPQAYLTKPYRREELTEALGRALAPGDGRAR